MTIRPDLIASRYDGLPVGPSLLYSFASQDAVPIDGTRKLPRDLSPFTLRLVLPEYLESLAVTGATAANVNAYDNANAQVAAQNATAESVQRQYGLFTVTDPLVASSPQARLASTEQVYYQGQALLDATGTVRKLVTLSDRLAALDVLYQARKILAAPALTLLVNPNSMATTYTAVQKYSDRTRYGFVFDRWGEEKPTISFSGSTGAFIAGENVQRAIQNTPRGNTTATGVQFASRLNSAAWQNFVALYQFFRNNGYLYDTYGKTEAHLAIGAVAIDYDQFTYIGHIDSFDYAFKAETPHRIDWNMEFVAGKILDRAVQPGFVGPLRTPVVNPLTGLVGVTPTSPASSTGQTFANPKLAQTPFELLGRR